jgi:hypothetical protein
MNKVISIRKRIEGKKKSEKKRVQESEYDKPMEVRDFREHGYFIIDDLFIDEYARLAGVYTSAVYFSLCRHANKDRMCWPSINRVAQQWKITARKVIQSLDWLDEHRIIKIHREAGKSNIYELLDKKKWVKMWAHKVVGMRKASGSSLEAFRKLNEEV